MSPREASAPAGLAVAPSAPGAPDVAAHLAERSHLPPPRGVGSNRRTVVELIRRRLAASAGVTLHFCKDAGRWRGTTGAEMDALLRKTTLGFAALGIEPGDRVVIVSNTRPEWGQSDAAALALGAVTVGIYPTSAVSQVRYICEHSEAALAVVEDAAQLEKLRAATDGLASLRRTVVIDPTGVAADGAEERLVTLDAVVARGEAALAEDADRFDRLCDAVREGDLATIMYTSGTTGPPKGVMLTHGALYTIAENAARVLPAGPDDISLIFLPLAHSLQRVASYAGCFLGVPGAYATSIDALMDEMREIRPTIQASVPRIWEKFYARIHATLAAAPARRQRIFAWALGVGKRMAAYRRRREAAPAWLCAQHRIADSVVFSRIRRRAGFDRVRYLTSGGAPISTEILEFFEAIGILIIEGYGLTETAAPATLNRVEDYKHGTVGKPIPGVRVRIAADGEIEIDSPGNLRGYYEDEAATRAAFTEDGWFRSGDIGEIDGEGFLRITDRKKDLIKTSAGKYVAPQVVESLIKQCPQISQAMVFGDRRNYCVALLTIDPEELRAWGEGHGLALPADRASLIAHPEVKRLVDGAVEAANAELSQPEKVKRWRVLDADFTQDDETLTPTMKLRRRAIAERFAAELEALYEE